LLDPGAPKEVRDFVVGCIEQVRYIRRSAPDSQSQAVITPKLIRAFQRISLALVGYSGEARLAGLAPLDSDGPYDGPCKDRWDSLALFLLDCYGTLDLSKTHLRAALDTYRREWLSEFSGPLNASNLDAVRQGGVAAMLDETYGGGARTGMIVLVPGKVRVLDDRKRTGTPKKPRPRSLGE
jgi:hypothetical protein